LDLGLQPDLVGTGLRFILFVLWLLCFCTGKSWPQYTEPFSPR